MSGAFTDQTIRARKIADTLSGGLKVRVSTFDERLTTVQARRSKRGKVRRDGTLDSAAATILLQAVIDKRNGGISS
ncbi:MAG TPA: Holliday junction resolvase RuvX, partial [Dehalococcoidia bacterium]|nr:Holliday junction resolvase RuvX [Dehalococcoidia bacterium]